MQLVNVAAVALNQTPMDWDGNLQNILGAIREARNIGANIICLPELCITGYGCEDAFFSPDVQKRALESLDEIRKATHYETDVVVCVGLPLVWNNSLYNVVAVVINGRLCGFVAKQNLASDGVHYESRWFKSWPAGIKKKTDEFVPIGDIIFNVSGIKVGFEICEDAWVANRPGSSLARRGVDIILNPSASHFALGKQEVRKLFVTEGSRAFRCAYVYANLLGNEAGRIIYDGDTMIATGGEIIAQGPRFTFGDRVITLATIDVDRNRSIQLQTGSFRPEYEEDDFFNEYINLPKDQKANHVAFSYVGKGLESCSASDEDYLFEEFRYAVALGLFDYMRKSKTKGFVLSLSGGADSSAVACLVYEMFNIGLHELGIIDFEKRLGCKADMNELLTCIYQETKNSSQETRKAAYDLSIAIGAHIILVNIDDIINLYKDIGELAVARELNWEQDDIALQNIQARVRAPSAWMVANLKNALLLVTSNRSEAGVGYTTMDGDTCGGLSVIGGIDKVFIRKFLRYIEDISFKTNLDVHIALELVNNLQPTAELRPKDKKQKDEEDLMPYRILNRIEQMAIRDKMSPRDIYLVLQFEGNSKEDCKVWIKRFFTLWSRNQWKRERFAIAFHLDDYNLDPKTACRFPVLSGGFKKELEELEGN